MSLFKRKPKEPVVSIFDSISRTAQDQTIEDIIDIVRMLKYWPERLFPNPEDRAKAGNEFQTIMRKVGMMAIGMAATMGEETDSKALLETLAKLPIPNSLRPMITAAYLTLVE